MSSTYQIEKYEVENETVTTELIPTTGSKGQVFVGNGTQMVQQTAGVDGQILTANSATSTGIEWTTFSGTPSTTFSQTIYGSADLRNGNNTYYYVWSFATSNSSQNNTDWYSSPAPVNIVGFSIRPGFDFGWYNSTPTQGDVTISFGTTPLNGVGQPPGDFNTLGVDLTVNYTDVLPNPGNRFRTFIVTGLNHTIPITHKWSLEVRGINWSAGGGFVSRLLITVYLNSTF